MTDPLPADVREYLEGPCGLALHARELLAKYPKPQPESAWQDGDVIITDGVTALQVNGGWDVGVDKRHLVMEGAELIARGGRRVHPARFHNHAETLRQIASEDYKPDHQSANWLRAIADDIDPNPEAASPSPPPRRNPYKAAL